jgi:hypothetical protein
MLMAEFVTPVLLPAALPPPVLPPAVLELAPVAAPEPVFALLEPWPLGALPPPVPPPVGRAVPSVCPWDGASDCADDSDWLRGDVLSALPGNVLREHEANNMASSRVPRKVRCRHRLSGG